MLPTGKAMPQVSSTTVILTSTMPCSWLDQVMMHGLSRTHGVHLGEKVDISDSLKEILVTSVKVLHSQFECLFQSKIVKLLNC